MTRTGSTWTYGTSTEFPDASVFTAMSGSGNRLLEGASWERVVHWLTQANDLWTLPATLPAPVSSIADGFGAVTAFGDRDEFVVGATRVANQGAVYIFAEPTSKPTPTPDPTPTLNPKGKRKVKNIGAANCPSKGRIEWNSG